MSPTSVKLGPTLNLGIAVLATLRLTRFITQDWLGEWWIVRPARDWALRAERSQMLRDATRKNPFERPPLPPIEHMALSDEPRTWQCKLVKGLDCPFCVGFWLGAAVLLSLAIARAVPPLLPIWRLVMAPFALNYVTGHISARLDG